MNSHQKPFNNSCAIILLGMLVNFCTEMPVLFSGLFVCEDYSIQCRMEVTPKNIDLGIVSTHSTNIYLVNSFPHYHSLSCRDKTVYISSVSFLPWLASFSTVFFSSSSSSFFSSSSILFHLTFTNLFYLRHHWETFSASTFLRPRLICFKPFNSMA